MKFNWGTGIFIFLALFLTAAGAFIIFAFSQDVNLVHKDYYKRGVNYSNQMDVEARSVKYKDILQTRLLDESLVIGFDDLPGLRIDSGNLLLYRPSDSKLDINLLLDVSYPTWEIPRQSLTSGRYILKVFWYSEGLKYEVNEPIIIN